MRYGRRESDWANERASGIAACKQRTYEVAAAAADPADSHTSFSHSPSHCTDGRTDADGEEVGERERGRHVGLAFSEKALTRFVASRREERAGKPAGRSVGRERSIEADCRVGRKGRPVGQLLPLRLRGSLSLSLFVDDIGETPFPIQRTKYTTHSWTREFK